MAVAMVMEWLGVTPEQYEEARRLVAWETNVAEGAIFHAARFTEAGLTVGDLWEREEDFQRFVEERLMPAVRQIGIEGEPAVRFSEVHDWFVAPSAVSA